MLKLLMLSDIMASLVVMPSIIAMELPGSDRRGKRVSRWLPAHSAQGGHQEIEELAK